MATEASSLHVFLAGDITFDASKPVGGGGYGDLFKGEHPTQGTLALKRLRSRIRPTDDPKIVKRAQNAYITEARIWRKLCHPHILLCMGVLHDSWDEIYLVSPWMDNGSLTDFVACHPGADRTQLLHDAAEGLAYLHQNDIVHGDIKGVNALVTAERRAVLCDFGLSKLASVVNTTTGGIGTPYWQSPELLVGGPRTKQADVYAFGIMIYEILSGRVPFEQYQPYAAILAVTQRNERPPKEPQHSPQGEPYAAYWGLAELCWRKVVDDRPSMAEVVTRWPSAEMALDKCETAKALYSRYEKHHEAIDLDEAIKLYRSVLVLHPPGHSERALSLHQLGYYLYDRYDLAHDASDLDEAITCQSEAVQLRPLGHPNRPVSLHQLGLYLNNRYNLSLNASDLEEAITLQREALQFRPPGDPERAMSLRNLGVNLNRQYDLTHNASDLDDAIIFQREMVQLCPAGHPMRVESFHSLGFYLAKRHTLAHNASDLDEAITVQREAVQLRPSGDPDRAVSLQNLGFYVNKRYLLAHNTSDLDEAITNMREAVQIRPLGDADRAVPLHQLGLYLNNRYDLSLNASDLDEAITVQREAVQIRPLGDADRPVFLHQLGLYLNNRYNSLHNTSDLEEAIQTFEEVVRTSQQQDRVYTDARQYLATLTKSQRSAQSGMSRITGKLKKFRF